MPDGGDEGTALALEEERKLPGAAARATNEALMGGPQLPVLTMTR